MPHKKKPQGASRRLFDKVEDIDPLFNGRNGSSNGGEGSLKHLKMNDPGEIGYMELLKQPLTKYVYVCVRERERERLNCMCIEV